jgi:DNA polymerase I
VKWDAHKTLFLIDGSSFLYRAYYGLKPLHTLEGIPVQAVFSFCRMIKKLIDAYKPEYCVLVWDSKGKTTRHEVFSEYKATRQAPPSDLFEQKDYIIRFAELIGLKQYEKSGYEADDLMFSLACEWMEHSDNAVVFVTLDKDMGQALTLGEHIYLLDAFKNEIFDRVALQEKMGFHVKQIPFYFALVGDTSDNIPGVKGIGKKTATDLVNQFDSLEDMYTRLYEVKKAGVQTALATYKDDALLSYSLFLLQYHPTHIHTDDMYFDIADWNKARPLFEELNFVSLLKEVGQTKQERVQNIQDVINYWKKYHFITVTTSEQLQELCAYLKAQAAFAFDTETTGLQSLSVELVGISVCADEEHAYYITCGDKTCEPEL